MLMFIIIIILTTTITSAVILTECLSQGLAACLASLGRLRQVSASLASSVFRSAGFASWHGVR